MALLLAHRGASREGPENTLAAFRAYQKCRSDGTEFDIRICQSGEIICFHDETPERTTDFKKKYPVFDPVPAINQLPWTMLKELDAGSWKSEAFSQEKIPLFEEVLATIGAEQFLAVEVKTRGIPEPRLAKNILEILQDNNRVGSTVIGSFNPVFLWQWKRLNTGFKIGLISEKDPPWYRSRHLWLPVLNPAILYLQKYHGMKAEIDRQHACNRKVMIWTVDTLSEMKECLTLGADGIISNCPELFSEL